MVSNKESPRLIRRSLNKAAEIAPMCADDILADRMGRYGAVVRDLFFAHDDIIRAGGVEDDFCIAAGARVAEIAFGFYLDRCYKRNMWGSP